MQSHLSILLKILVMSHDVHVIGHMMCTQHNTTWSDELKGSESEKAEKE